MGYQPAVSTISGPKVMYQTVIFMLLHGDLDHGLVIFIDNSDIVPYLHIKVL